MPIMAATILKASIIAIVRDMIMMIEDIITVEETIMIEAVITTEATIIVDADITTRNKS